MSSRSFNRKEFLVLSVSTVTAGALAGCSDDPAPGGGTSGSGGTPGGGSGGSGGMAGSTTGGSTSGAGGSTAGSTSGGGGAGGSGTAGGGAGGSGTAGGGAGGGGAGGGTGGGGAGGGGAGGMCGTAKIMQTSNELHTHIVEVAMLEMNLKNHINGAMATMEFTLPGDGQGDHDHEFTLTADQVTMLKGGGMVTGVTTAPDNTGHSHTYTISCMS